MINFVNASIIFRMQENGGDFCFYGRVAEVLCS